MGRLEPASTTKLLTALFALSIVRDTSMTITASDELELVAEDASRAYILEGQTLTVEMLIEAMLLPSGNDAAYVLAAGVGRLIADEPEMFGKDDVLLFMQGVNDYGKSIGLQSTNFTVPDGYTEKNHYTCLQDMMVIAIHAAENEVILKYAGTVRDEVTYASGEENVWTNGNNLINPESPYYFPYAKGLKTGTTNAAGYCLVALAEKDGRRIVAGTFAARTNAIRYDDMLTLLTYGLAH